MTLLACGLGAAVVALSAWVAAERLRRVAAERERDGFRRVAFDVVGRVGEFCGVEPPLESVR